MAAAMSMAERREALRVPAADRGLDRLAVMRPGLEVTVADVSSIGARLEGAASCRVGCGTDVVLLGADDGLRIVVKCVVVRCAVVALAPLRFEYGVRFDRELPSSLRAAQGSG